MTRAIRPAAAARGSRGQTLTIYSSLPLQGTSKGQSEAVISGEKLALKNAGNKVGKYNIKYVSLDDSTAQNPGTADEAQTASNARKAVQDETTIFYLGEFNSGGTKVSLPILNKADIPQISPSNTYVGLTTDKPGSEPGEPDKYYPAQKRTYARVVPADDIQAAALVTTMKEDGCKSSTSSTTRPRTALVWRATSSWPPRRRASRSRATTAPTATPRTTARSRRRSRPTASSARA